MCQSCLVIADRQLAERTAADLTMGHLGPQEEIGRIRMPGRQVKGKSPRDAGREGPVAVVCLPPGMGTIQKVRRER